MKLHFLIVIGLLLGSNAFACSFTVSASNSGPICAGAIVTLTGSTTATSFTWSGPGGYTSASATPSVSLSIPGTYTYTLTATDGTCTSTATTTVVVNAAPHRPLVSSSATAICNGSSALLAASVHPPLDTVVFQNFNTSIGPWTVDISGSSGAAPLTPWQLEPSGYYYPAVGTFSRPDGSEFAIANADNLGPGSTTSSKLISPVFSLAGYTSATLSFDHFYQYWAAGDVRANVEISTDGGITWTTIHNYVGANVGTDAAFANATWSLNACLGQPNCRVRFWYYANWGWWWAIDNVMITATGNPTTSPSWSPATGLFTDAALTSPYVPGFITDSVYVHPTSYTSATTLTYSVTVTGGGCSSSAATLLTVNPTPSPIAGTASLCNGNTTTMTDAMPGGTWSSSNPLVATVGVGTGIVTAMNTGGVTITYTSATGCSATKSATITASPLPITGLANPCEGTVSALSDMTSGGTWSSSNVGVAIVSSTGVVNALSAGTATITYSLAGCASTRTITVSALPAAITGPSSICLGSSSALSSTSTGGAWSSSNPAIATVNASTGAVTGINPGVATITYSLPAGCSTTTPVTVNSLPASITGASAICAGASTSMSTSSTGGTWSSSNTAVATINSSTGVLSGISQGTANITYTSPAGCITTKAMTINALPAPISGGATLCEGATTILHDSTAGGTWSSAAGTVALAGSLTGVVSGVSAGTATIAYRLSNGCMTTATVTVNPKPAAFSMSGGGGYCSGAPGVHVGLSGSTTGITYQLYNGATTTISVAGTGSAVDFGVQTTPGTYTAVATNTATGCSTSMPGSANVAINAAPTAYAVTGGGSYCAGGVGVHVELANSNTGINYQLYRGTIACGPSIAGTGAALDFGAQSVAGTYTVRANNVSTSCVNNMSGTANISLSPAPPSYSVTGGGSYCPGGAGVHIGLNASTTGVNYQLYRGMTAVGGAMGGTGSSLDFGLQTGSGLYSVVATNGTSCAATMAGSASVALNSAPIAYPVTGGGSYCDGGSGVNVGIAGSATGIYYQLVSGMTPIGTAVPGTGGAMDFGRQTAAGIYSVVATDAFTSCHSTMTGTANITINSLPSLHSVTGGGNYCADGTGVNVGIDGTEAGVTYMLYKDTSLVAAPLAGTGSSADFGLQLAAGNYSVVAINTSTSCASRMTDTVTVGIIPVVTPSISLHSSAGDTICSGTMATFTVATTNAGSLPALIWSVNGSTTGSGNSFTYAPSNGDSIRVTLTSSATCASPRTVTSVLPLTVYETQTPSVTVAANPGNIVCLGTAVNYTATTLYGGSVPTLTWMKNGIVAGSGLMYSDLAQNGDSVYCVMTSNYRCRTTDQVASNQITMEVDTPSNPVVSIAPVSGVSSSAGKVETLVATVVNGGSSPMYQWSINGAPITGATNAAFTSSFSGMDSVACVVTKLGTCSGLTGTAHIIINGATTTGINTTSHHSAISLSPNPNNGTFNVTGLISANSKTADLQVINMAGQVAVAKTVALTNGEINEQISLTGSLANGIYLLKVTADNAEQVFQVVVEK